jgi:hypothetical protein
LVVADFSEGGHLASPDVHFDEARQLFILYYHCPTPLNEAQQTFVATSVDGLTFTPYSAEFHGQSYFRVFQHQGTESSQLAVSPSDFREFSCETIWKAVFARIFLAAKSKKLSPIFGRNTVHGILQSVADDKCLRLRGSRSAPVEKFCYFIAQT